MRKNPKFAGHAAVAFLGLLIDGHVWAQGGAPESLDHLTSASSAIVVGTIAQGTVSGATVSLSLAVERALKGAWPSGTILSAVGTLSEPLPTRAALQSRGIFFLSGTVAGPMRLSPAIAGHLPDEMELFIPLPDASAPAIQPTSGSTLKERVMLEILGGMEAGPLKRLGGFIDILAEYRATPMPSVRVVFQRWLASGSDWRVSYALRALLPEGDTTVLAYVAGDSEMRSSAVDPHAFDGLKWYFNNADPAAVNLLGQLVTGSASSVALRIAAATALARVHTRQALPYLASLLESPDATLRACAVGGLAMFANNVPIGSHEPAGGGWAWRTEETIAHSSMDQGTISYNPAYYIGFWKSWWAANRIALSQ